MLDCEVIQPSNSEWSSPSVLVQKKDGNICWCIDFRAINNVTRKDAYPLPLIKECLDALSDTEYMSTLDMQFGYWQVEVHLEDCHKTAFLTKQGLFEFTCMSFGLCNAPATFQWAVQLVFWGMTWKEILTYLDDLNVIGNGFHDHLQKSFECLHKYQLKLKPCRCCLFQTEVPFLGWLVSNKMVAVDPNKIKAILEWPVPKSRKGVETFLGFVNYHLDHIKEYAHISACLYELTGPKGTYNWTAEHQAAFESLRECLVCAPILSCPNNGDTFILDTDASDVAIGAELLQAQRGEEKVISYGIFSLTPCQCKYCTTHKEL